MLVARRLQFRPGMRASRKESGYRARLRARLIFTTALSIWLTGSSRSQAQGHGRTQFSGITIGAIVIDGLHHIREDVVRDQLDVHVGDTFQDGLIAGNIQRLDRLGVFSRNEKFVAQRNRVR